MICRHIGGDVITTTSVGMSQHHQTPAEWIYVKRFDVIGFRWYDDDSVIPYTYVNCGQDKGNLRYGSIPDDGIDRGTLVPMDVALGDCREYSLQAYIEEGSKSIIF